MVTYSVLAHFNLTNYNNKNIQVVTIEIKFNIKSVILLNNCLAHIF